MTLVLGDLHNNYNYLLNEIKDKEITDCNIIQVGDFSIFKDDILCKLNNFLKYRNIILYAIRGNHDDPNLFTGEHIFSNLRLLPDYTVLNIDNQNILFVGGATSVDRKISLRKMASGESEIPIYWEDEVFQLDEEKLKDISNIDIIITHTCPEWCYPNNRLGFSDFVLNYAENDKDLLNDLNRERELVSRMFNILKENGNKIKKHYYGHFHTNEITEHNGTTHILLGICEMRYITETTQEEYEKIFNKK